MYRPVIAVLTHWSRWKVIFPASWSRHDRKQSDLKKQTIYHFTFLKPAVQQQQPFYFDGYMEYSETNKKINFQKQKKKLLRIVQTKGPE